MKKIYYLKTCGTCKKILASLPNIDSFELQEIKKEPITVKQLQELYNITKSYEKLFNKRAKLYKERNLKDEVLKEEDYKNLILEDYTFLNRPVIVFNETLFAGNSKKNVEAAIEFPSSKK